MRDIIFRRLFLFTASLVTGIAAVVAGWFLIPRLPGHPDLKNDFVGIVLFGLGIVAVLDADGRVVLNTGQAPLGFDARDRPYYRIHIGERVDGLAVTELESGALTTRSYFSVSRRIETPDGRLLGIVAALALDYPRFTVWVLDDGCRPWLEALAEDLGARYLARRERAGFKAGTGDAHHLVNRSDQAVVYLEIGDRTPADAASYPDDDIVAELDENGRWQFSHKDGSSY